MIYTLYYVRESMLVPPWKTNTVVIVYLYGFVSNVLATMVAMRFCR